MEKLRICFAGTPAFAAAHLKALLDSPHQMIAVYTQPDRPAGRGKKLQPSAVKQLALAHALDVYQPHTLKAAEQQQLLRKLAPDVLVVVAYGLILPQAILDIPRLACINVHASLLPRWRGAAPIERALLAGDKVTGVTVMRMDAGLDTGDMLATAEVVIESQDTRADLEEKLARIGPTALIAVLNNVQNALASAVKQDDALSTYAAKLDKKEALIHWDSPAELIHRQVRVGHGRTPAYCFLHGERVRILEAEPIAQSTHAAPGTIVAASPQAFNVACQESQLTVSTVQLPGKTAMAVRDVFNSKPDLFKPGAQFSHLEFSPE